MNFLIIGIIILTISILYLVRDINKVFRINSIITIVSGYLIIIITSLLNIIIRSKISFINISTITNLLLKKGINRGLILILIGAIQLIIHIFINIYKGYYYNELAKEQKMN